MLKLYSPLYSSPWLARDYLERHILVVFYFLSTLLLLLLLIPSYLHILAYLVWRAVDIWSITLDTCQERCLATVIQSQLNKIPASWCYTRSRQWNGAIYWSIPKPTALLLIGASPSGMYERSQSPISFLIAFAYISTPYSKSGKIMLTISQLPFHEGKVPNKETVIPFPELLKSIYFKQASISNHAEHWFKISFLVSILG